MSQKKIVQSAGAPQAIGPYSQAVVQDGWIFLSGQIPLDPKTGQLVAGSIGDQTKRVLENLGAVLETVGCSYPHVVKTTVYLVDLADFSAMNEVYGKYFTSEPPARATVQVAALPKGARIEIDAVARVP